MRGAFKQVLRAHIFHVTLFSIAVRPIQTEFIFSSLMLWTVNVITHPPIARSRRSRWNDIFPSLKNQLLSLFPEKIMLLIFKLLFAACTYYVTILICESKTQNKAKKQKQEKTKWINDKDKVRDRKREGKETSCLTKSGKQCQEKYFS